MLKYNRRFIYKNVLKYEIKYKNKLARYKNARYKYKKRKRKKRI